MIEENGDLQMHLARLKEGFDRSFAKDLAKEPERHEDFLAIRIGGKPFALRVKDLAGIERRRKIEAFDSDQVGLLGIAGIRSRLVAVFSLSRLLNMGESNDEAPWLALIDIGELVALAFESYEGYVRVAEDQIFGNSEAERKGEVMLRYQTEIRPVLNAKAILEERRRQLIGSNGKRS